MDSYRSDSFNANAILISGYAKLPANITSEEVYKMLVVAMVVDRRTGIIIEAEASLVTELSKRFVASLMKGYDLNEGPEKLIRRFEDYYFGSAKKAVETVIRMIFAKYEDYKSGAALRDWDDR